MGYLTIILILLLVSAFFSGMEAAFIGANKLRIELDKKQGLISSRIINIFILNPEFYTTTLLIGKILTFSVFGIVIVQFTESIENTLVISKFGIIVIQIFASAFLIFVFAEFIPKTAVRINPNFVLNLGALPLFIIFILFYPVSYIIIKIIEAYLKRPDSEISMNNKGNVFSKIDLYHFVAEHSEDIKDDTPSSDEMKLFQNALEFSSVRVRDCMIPRTEIVAMEVNSSIEKLKQKFFETGYSKILIFENDFDNIIGYITSKELFRHPKNIRSLLIQISFVPEAMQASALLHKLIQEHKSMSVIVDEFGGISGLVTVEDIIEEIFGEIEDEHDSQELVEKKINENEYIFSGRIEIEVINEKYKLNITETEDFATLAGYIFYHYQSFPKVNERIVIGPYEFRILKVTKTRIELVHLKIIAK